LITFAVVVDMF